MTLHDLDLKDLSNDDSFKSIAQSEVLAMTKHIKNGKAVSVDKFLTKFSKMRHAFNILCSIYNVFLQRGVIPDLWRKALISPIFKGKGKSRNDPLGYRPVSL